MITRLILIVGDSSDHYSLVQAFPVPPQRPLFPTVWPDLQIMLTDDGSRTLFDSRLGETYHSGCGALAECLVVYLRNSGVESRLQQASSEQSASSGDPVRILELGFGTGMAFLLTAAAACAYACPLEYTSIENRLLPREILAELKIGQAILGAIQAGHLPTAFAVAERLEAEWLEFRASLPSDPIDHEITWVANKHLRLRLILSDAQHFLACSSTPSDEVLSAPNVDATHFDAIYYDAFSPSSNPVLWSDELLQATHNQLRPEGNLVSYCVSGPVRRSLQRAGFQVSRLPGPPGGKREVLLATKPASG